MKLGVSHGKAMFLRTVIGTAFISGFVFALVLAAAPHLHERIHQPIGASHECVVTLIASGKYQLNEAPVLAPAPQPALQFSKIPALPSVWVPALFLGACILEHAPPAHS